MKGSNERPSGSRSPIGEDVADGGFRVGLGAWLGEFWCLSMAAAPRPQPSARSVRSAHGA